MATINMLNGRWFSLRCNYFNFGLTLDCSTFVLQSLTINASWVRRFCFITRSANFARKINDFFRLYTHFTHFSCKICLYLTHVKLKRHQILNLFLQLKEKRMDFNVASLGLSLDVLIYIIRYSKPKSEVWRFDLLVYKCMYNTWVNVNLKLTFFCILVCS